MCSTACLYRLRLDDDGLISRGAQGRMSHRLGRRLWKTWGRDLWCLALPNTLSWGSLGAGPTFARCSMYPSSVGAVFYAREKASSSLRSE